MKDRIIAALNHNKTRYYNSQPLPVGYSKTVYQHGVRGVTAMQQAFMNAVQR